tara:strand:- start:12801 stop:13436 length:636 start_codon:yes stop_codon:yes gene_type:complete
MFSKDRDLVVHDPGLMRDVGWAGQRRLSVIGGISGTQLTIETGSFVDAGIEAGHAVLFDGITLEVVSVDSATTATVSLMRADALGAAVPPIEADTRTVVVHDFSAQRSIVHRQVLTMLGIDAQGEHVFGIDETMITNTGALNRLETLGTLHLIYAGASAPSRANDRFEQRAELYRQRYQRERESVIAMIDTDGDGIAEVTRRPNAFVLARG